MRQTPIDNLFTNQNILFIVKNFYLLNNYKKITINFEKIQIRQQNITLIIQSEKSYNYTYGDQLDLINFFGCHEVNSEHPHPTLLQHSVT